MLLVTSVIIRRKNELREGRGLNAWKIEGAVRAIGMIKLME